MRSFWPLGPIWRTVPTFLRPTQDASSTPSAFYTTWKPRKTNLCLGRRVVVYGGGNTAVDVARTAKRMGAEEAIIVYRRTRDQMPAHDFEMDEAMEEGVIVNWLTTIKEVGDGGKVMVERMELDENGKPQPTGEMDELEADTVVMALGQNVDTAFVEKLSGVEIKDKVIQVDTQFMTGHPGVFAGGDMVPSERTVTVAVGHGKHAARSIHAWLQSETYVKPEKPELADFDKLNGWYYTDAPETVQNMLDVERRKSTFGEVVDGLDESNALYEARRCLSCGNCFECDNCYGVCPDNAVIKLGPGKRFEFDYDFCKGLRRLCRRMPVRCDQDGSRRNLDQHLIWVTCTKTVLACQTAGHSLRTRPAARAIRDAPLDD